MYLFAEINGHKFYYWRASGASETLTSRGNTIENRGCLFIGEGVERARQY